MKWLRTFGAVEISDCVWRDSGGGLRRPLPERIGVCSRGKSLRLQRALTDFGEDESFAKTSAKVKEHYGLDVGAGTVRAVTLKHAALPQSRERECGGRAFRALPGDGADWIERLLREIFGESAEYLLDYCHLLKYLAAVAERIAPVKE